MIEVKEIFVDENKVDIVVKNAYIKINEFIKTTESEELLKSRILTVLDELYLTTKNANAEKIYLDLLNAFNGLDSLELRKKITEKSKIIIPGRY